MANTIVKKIVLTSIVLTLAFLAGSHPAHAQNPTTSIGDNLVYSRYGAIYARPNAAYDNSLTAAMQPGHDADDVIMAANNRRQNQWDRLVMVLIEAHKQDPAAVNQALQDQGIVLDIPNPADR